MRNEAIKVLTHYFRNKSNDVQFLGNDEGVNLFADILNNGETIAGDAPDAVIKKDNVAIIIEHFEFDSFHTNRKGSSSRMEQARIEREQMQVLADIDEGVYHGKIDATCSYQYYVENVTKNFTEHYKRIDDYKNNLIAKNIIADSTIVKMMFLIEDVSPVGSIAIDYSDGKPRSVPVILAQSAEFLELVENANDLDYVLCCSYACDSEYIWFVDRNEISAYREQQCDYASMQFLSNKPNVLIGKVSIPYADE